MLNEGVKLGETVCAVLIPASEDTMFDELIERGSLCLCHDSRNWHVYSKSEYVRMLTNEQAKRFSRKLSKMEGPIVKVVESQVVDVKVYK